MDNSNVLIVGEDDAGQRFDKFLIRQFPEGGKGFVYKMLRKKRIKLNGERAQGNELLRIGDKVTLYIAPETRLALSGEQEKTSDIVIRVLYEDEHVLVVNKPAGCLTHPELTDAAASYIGKRVVDGGVKAFEPAAVNRLDRNTSGIVIIAKTLTAARELSAAIRERKLDKFYLAAVKGDVSSSIRLTGGHTKDRTRNIAQINHQYESDFKEAVTEIAPLGGRDGVTILCVKLVTGRSHQIRAHLASIGTPVLGDPKYGGGSGGQLLHAWRVVFGGLESRLAYLNGKEVVCPPEGTLLRIIKQHELNL